MIGRAGLALKHQLARDIAFPKSSRASLDVGLYDDTSSLVTQHACQLIADPHSQRSLLYSKTREHTTCSNEVITNAHFSIA